MRKLASLVTIDSINPIPKADAIEVARIGGWSAVVKKGEFAAGEVALYIEIDAFLPDGQPAWQFLVDKQPMEHNGVRGHVLRTVTLRKQVSQGLLVKPALFADRLQNVALGEDVGERLGIAKYEAPIPKELEGLARGMYPTSIPKTDQERIQNLSTELDIWQDEGAEWEVTEKLEGASVTYALLDGEVHACSRTVDYLDLEGNTMWAVAHRLGLPEALQRVCAGHNVAIQGELVGPGIEGNIYKLSEHRFYVYDIYDTDMARYLGAAERYALTAKLGLTHVPVIASNWKLDGSATMEAILAKAVGPSALLASQTREGEVYKRLDGKTSFKGISNVYLAGQGK